MACSKVISDFEGFSADDLGRLRDRSGAEKVRIVEESFCGYRQGSTTARRYGLLRSLLTQWRNEYRVGLLGCVALAFTPLQIAPDPASTVSTRSEKLVVEDKVEITLSNGRRLSVASMIDATALSRLLRVLDRV